MTFSSVRGTAQTLAIGLFFAGICLPLGATFLGWNMPTPSDENRPLATFPSTEWTYDNVEAFPDKFEKYWTDHMGYRPNLVRLQARSKVKVLGVSSSSQVALGKDGWLFLNGDKNLEDYRATEPFSSEQLEQCAEVFQARHDWLADRGIRYLLVLAPNKQTVYPERMPKAINRVNPETRLDQLTARLRERSTVSVLDLRGPLMAAKDHDQLFLKLDTHWNDCGAYWAYRATLETLSQWYPNLQPWERKAFAVQESVIRTGDLARMLGLNHSLKEIDQKLIPLRPRLSRDADVKPYVEARRHLPPGQWPFATACSAPGLPKAVMFRDSFAQAMSPYLSEHFSRIVYFFQDHLDLEALEKEKPDVVIQEMVERHLMAEIHEDDQVLQASRKRLPVRLVSRREGGKASSQADSVPARR